MKFGIHSLLFTETFLEKDLPRLDSFKAMGFDAVEIIPFDPEKPFVTSGIRLGTPAGTTRGFGEKEFDIIGDLITEVLDGLQEVNSDEGNAKAEAAVKAKILDLVSDYPLYSYL